MNFIKKLFSKKHSSPHDESNIPKIKFSCYPSNKIYDINDKNLHIYKYIQENYPVVPAQSVRPDWFKRISHLQDYEHEDDIKNKTMKFCPGTFDFMYFGYLMPMWQEVELYWGGQSIDDVTIHTSSALDDPTIDYHIYPFSTTTSEGVPGMQTYPVIKFESPWKATTSHNISLLHQYPFYRKENDYHILPGIQDCFMDKAAVKLMNFFIQIRVKNKIIHFKPGDILAQLIPIQLQDYEYKVELNDQDVEYYKQINAGKFIEIHEGRIQKGNPSFIINRCPHNKNFDKERFFRKDDERKYE
tara:strand:+ start:864 stop:1763 length:900 start_codon:yes stop_codon:yes gene_type:complete